MAVRVLDWRQLSARSLHSLVKVTLLPPVSPHTGEKILEQGGAAVPHSSSSSVSGAGQGPLLTSVGAGLTPRRQFSAAISHWEQQPCYGEHGML